MIIINYNNRQGRARQSGPGSFGSFSAHKSAHGVERKLENSVRLKYIWNDYAENRYAPKMLILKKVVFHHNLIDGSALRCIRETL